MHGDFLKFLITFLQIELEHHDETLEPTPITPIVAEYEPELGSEAKNAIFVVSDDHVGPVDDEDEFSGDDDRIQSDRDDDDDSQSGDDVEDLLSGEVDLFFIVADDDDSQSGDDVEDLLSGEVDLFFIVADDDDEVDDGGHDHDDDVEYVEACENDFGGSGIEFKQSISKKHHFHPTELSLIDLGRYFSSKKNYERRHSDIGGGSYSTSSSYWRRAPRLNYFLLLFCSMITVLTRFWLL